MKRYENKWFIIYTTETLHKQTLSQGHVSSTWMAIHSCSAAESPLLLNYKSFGEAGLMPKIEIQATFPGSPKICVTFSGRSNSQHETWAAAFVIRHFIQVEAAAVPERGAGSSRRAPFLWHAIIPSCSALPLQAALLGSLHTSTLAALSFPA